MQIQARILFAASRCIWQAVPPEIRMPKMCPRFIHPYVGALEEDRFAKALILNDDYLETKVNISDEAQRLFAGRLDPCGVARARDICISGQTEQIHTLENHVRESSGHNKADLFDLVRGIWQLGRQGLCRSHEGNSDRPRVSLDNENMLYPISDKTRISNNKLSTRIFRYHA